MTQSKAVLERLAAMVRLYRRCLDLTREILEKGYPDDDDLATGLFDQRTKIINKIKKLEENLEIRQEEGQHFLLGIADSDIKEAEGLLDKLQGLITELIAADRRLRKRLEEEAAQTGRELKQVERGHLTLKRYAPYRGGISYYINRRS